MKFLFSRFVIVLMLLSALSVAVPTSSGLSSTYTDDSAGNNERLNPGKADTANQCHFSNDASCCYIDCDLKYAPLFSRFKSLPEIHSIAVFNVFASNLHRIYFKPLTPPPILS